MGQICPLELQLNKANASDSEVPFFFEFTFIYFKRICSSETYNKRDDFDFDIINFPFWMWTFPVLPLTVFYISLRFARLSSYRPVFNTRDENLNAKLIHPGYRHHTLRKTFL